MALWACGCGQKPPVSAVPKEAVPVTGAARGITYTVRRGDTLVSIANSYRVPASSIMKANGLRDTKSIYVGQVLLIPSAAAMSSRPGKLPDLSNIVSESHFIWPLRGRVIRRFDPSGADFEHRRGIVIEARSGEPVLAAMSGVVTFASEAFQGFGKTLVVRHAGNISTFYAYNSRILVHEGDVVRQGQPIAEAGQSGRAESPQLLFRILQGEEPLNPHFYLP
jgi:lipoprotein NlpD